MTRQWRTWALLVAVLASVSPVLAAQATTPEAKAEIAERAWLALIDNGRYNESWKAASPSFQAAVTQANWASAAASVRTPLGKVLTRKVETARHTTTLPGAPDGDYVVTLYDTSFEQKSEAKETVTVRLEKDGSWRSIGYYIR